MLFAFYYVKWHYGQAVTDYINIVKNFVWFFFEFFSIRLMFKTLFAPFHKLGETYKGKGLHPSAIAEAIVVNTLMRLVGFLLRTTLILLGIFFILCTIVFGAIFLIVWILAPAFLLFLLLYGIKMISIP